MSIDHSSMVREVLLVKLPYDIFQCKLSFFLENTRNQLKHVTLFNVTCFAKHVTLNNVTCLVKYINKSSTLVSRKIYVLRIRMTSGTEIDKFNVIRIRSYNFYRFQIQNRYFMPLHFDRKNPIYQNWKLKFLYFPNM